MAAETKEKKLYAIEWVKRRVYALCRLGDWVRREDVVARSRCVLREESQTKRRALQPAEKGKLWWMSAAVDMTEIPTDVIEITPKLDLKAALVERKEDSAVPVDEHMGLNSGPEGLLQEGEAAQSATDAMQELARHYLEALYLSRTPLAYFTKGPLSRARAALNAMSNSTATSELVGFLRESILTSGAMDKKFKDHISSTVKNLPVVSVASPEQPKKTKRKRKWKPKRDKHGFFTDEKDVVEKWWRDHDTSTSSAETIDEALRRRLPKLRSRETFMQLIFILEALALEASMPAILEEGEDTETTGAVETQTAQTQQEDTQGATGEKNSKKPKKKQDLSALLETLLDKLCIWHSLESHSPLKKAGTEAEAQDEPIDELRSFCIEVIVPFYVSRIPQHAAIVNKKLGGPSAPTPVKRKSAPTRKPGEPAVRRAPEKKPRKPLARVGSETLDHQSRPLPALHRSATDTDALSSYIKREASEVPMDSIPAVNQSRKPRQSLMHTLDSSRRQVDLNAMSQANDAKLQRKAEMQEKMQSAINMLRKPNRAAALAEIRDQTDESFAKATAAAKGRSGGASHKGKSAQRGQIEATPSHRRTVKATPFKRAAEPLQSERLYSSGTTHVPSSSIRLAQGREVLPASSFAVPQTGHRPRHSALGASNVEETPSRGFAKFMPAGLAREPGTLDSPTVSRKIVATPSKPVRSLSLGVGATPALVAVSPNLQRHETNMRGEGPASKSIYDSLGWDEDEYEELT